MMTLDTYNVGIYCRLSRDDGNDSVSMSIENQKNSLTEYVKKQNWNLIDVYIDDGVSGTSFEREGFQRMIQDIEFKKINLVICRDLSRLGRNYLMTGHYTENYFPKNNVRFIAINDNYDSLQENEFAPFKNIINEWYAKDISKKIRHSLNYRMSQPQILGCGSPLYGYLNTEDKRRIPNPETAPIVKRIAREYISGKTAKQIVAALKAEGIYTPGYYNYIKYGINRQKYGSYETLDQKCNWRQSMVSEILTSVEYTGTLVNHKKEVRSFKSKDVIRLPKDKSFVFEDLYEALISKEDHKIIKNMHKNYHIKPLNDIENTLQGLLTCSNCGSILKFRKRVYSNKKDTSTWTRRSYECRNTKCNCRAAINVEVIKDIITKEISKVKSLLLSNEEDFLNYASTILNGNSFTNKDIELDNQISRLNSDANKLDVKIEKLFEANMNDEIPYSTYQKMMDKYKDEKSEIEDSLRKLKNNKSKPKTVNYLALANQIIESLKKLNDNDLIDRSILIYILKHVLVSKKENEKFKIEIVLYGSNLIKGYEECKQ